MASRLILASGSSIRQALLTRVGLDFTVVPARIDEDAIRASLEAEGAKPRDVADALAEYKALKVSQKDPQAHVIGSDQILEMDNQIFTKPDDRAHAEAQLKTLRGKTHRLYSAAVVYQDGKPLWRFVGRTDMTMRNFSDGFLQNYLNRNWDSVKDTVGCYKLEEEGARLFSRVSGDYFNVLGLPLLELVSYLTALGFLDE